MGEFEKKVRDKFINEYNKICEPCPFCGSVAEIERRGTGRQSMIIVCQGCGCRIESGDVYGLTPVGLWKWNTRRGGGREDGAKQERKRIEGTCACPDPMSAGCHFLKDGECLAEGE